MIIYKLKKKLVLFMVNKIYAGRMGKSFEIKRQLLNSIGYEIGEGTKIVGPIFCTGKLIVGTNTWIGKNFFINGNGTVTIGKNCDIAPEVACQTGGNEIGKSERRAGKGIIYSISIGDGCWIGARSTILGGSKVGKGSVVAACSCVCNDIPENCLFGGVPAKLIRELEE